MKLPNKSKKKEKEKPNFPKILTHLTLDHYLTRKDGFINGKEKISKNIKKILSLEPRVHLMLLKKEKEHLIKVLLPLLWKYLSLNKPIVKIKKVEENENKP
jgi:hypothetical protein